MGILEKIRIGKKVEFVFFRLSPRRCHLFLFTNSESHSHSHSRAIIIAKRSTSTSTNLVQAKTSTSASSSSSLKVPLSLQIQTRSTQSIALSSSSLYSFLSQRTQTQSVSERELVELSAACHCHCMPSASSLSSSSSSISQQCSSSSFSSSSSAVALPSATQEYKYNYSYNPFTSLPSHSHSQWKEFYRNRDRASASTPRPTLLRPKPKKKPNCEPSSSSHNQILIIPISSFSNNDFISSASESGSGAPASSLAYSTTSTQNQNQCQSIESIHRTTLALATTTTTTTVSALTQSLSPNPNPTTTTATTANTNTTTTTSSNNNNNCTSISIKSVNAINSTHKTTTVRIPVSRLSTTTPIQLIQLFHIYTHTHNIHSQNQNQTAPSAFDLYFLDSELDQSESSHSSGLDYLNSGSGSSFNSSSSSTFRIPPFQQSHNFHNRNYSHSCTKKYCRDSPTTATTYSYPVNLSLSFQSISDSKSTDNYCKWRRRQNSFGVSSVTSRKILNSINLAFKRNLVPCRLFSTTFTSAPCFGQSESNSSSTSTSSPAEEIGAHPSTRNRNSSTNKSSAPESSSSCEMSSTKIHSLTAEKLTSLKTKFLSDSKNVLAQNACARTDPIELCTSRAGLDEINHIFNNRIESEGKPITNQKSSGRCWLFAFLNCVRIPFMKHYNIDEFEFSQSYLFFYDKLERCHYFLHNVVETYDRGERVDGRLVSFLLQDPCSDGGQWTMVSNLVLRYGLMPKKNFQESFSSESTSRLNSILRSKLREFCKELRDLMEEGKSKEVVQEKIDEQLEKIFRIISICLGIPKDQFTWEYYDKSKNYHKVGPITPLKFYEEYVKPVYKIDDKVCLVNDPREFHPYNKAYTIDCLGNVVGGSPTIYNNQHIDLLESVAVSSIKKGDPVWFGCEVVKRFAAKQGIEDLTIHDYSLVFGTDVSLGLTKAERLIYGESCMTHAMVFTACSVDDNGKVLKWRVENSWGDDRGEKGYFVMSADWFKEFVFELVVDKSLVPPEVMNVFELQPTILPAWDPMGTLACKNCTGCSHCES